MLEARELVQECITKGEQSAGYREFCGLAPGRAAPARQRGLPALHRVALRRAVDRGEGPLRPARSAQPCSGRSARPSRQLLEILNATELARVWGEDETIGWVYQFFNSQDERRKMRDESQAPRNSRELAVRNQFFTPRYVVQFLTDNTLGRIWYEMRGGEHGARRALRVPGPQARRGARRRARRRIPRDLRVLDPACGSGHFLLYAFDLLAHDLRGGVATIRSRRASRDRALRCRGLSDLDCTSPRVPALILEHNLHGVDIDPRARRSPRSRSGCAPSVPIDDFGIRPT